MQAFLSRGFEASRKIAATERVRDWLPSGTLPDGIGSGGTGVGDESILTELVESFPGDEGKGDWTSENILYGCRTSTVLFTFS